MTSLYVFAAVLLVGMLVVSIALCVSSGVYFAQGDYGSSVSFGLVGLAVGVVTVALTWAAF